MAKNNCGNQIEESKISFWRKNLKAVPGRPSPKKDRYISSTMLKASDSTSFNEYQASVSDAWDIAEDELNLISNIADLKISKKSTCLNVDTLNCSLCVHNAKSNKPNKNEQKQNNSIKDNSNKIAENIHNTLINQERSSFEKLYYPGRPKALHASTLPVKDNENYEIKLEKFELLLNANILDLMNLRHLSWSGIPLKVRAVTWRLLSGYIPVNFERRDTVLERKRLDYWNLVKQYYDIEKDETYQDIYRQIHIDIPRMSPLIRLFQQTLVQEMFERILFIWAIRHPASGYVQGINDLVTPFFVVFLQEIVPIDALDEYDISKLTKKQRNIIEADSFWCLSKFLDSIQDNYIFAQLGIQQKVNQLKELIQRIDAPLHKHLTEHGVDYLQFSFRWLNNLLTRELPLHCTIRLWDTYLAEADEFATFQLYVCAAFLLYWRDSLLKQEDFQGLLVMLQNLPTSNWTHSHISMLVAEAYRLKFMFADAPNHLTNSKSTS